MDKPFIQEVISQLDRLLTLQKERRLLEVEQHEALVYMQILFNYFTKG